MTRLIGQFILGLSDLGSPWLYTIILILSFAEGFPIFGFFSPGGISCLLAGVLIKISGLRFYSGL